MIEAHDRGHEILGHVTVDAGTERDAGDDPGPDLADDLAHVRPGETEARRPVDARIRCRGDLAALHLPDPVFEVPLHASAAMQQRPEDFR
jgi:hypothetical protein